MTEDKFYKYKPLKDCIFYTSNTKEKSEQCQCLNDLYCSLDNKCRFYKCNRVYAFDPVTGYVYKYVR